MEFRPFCHHAQVSPAPSGSTAGAHLLPSPWVGPPPYHLVTPVIVGIHIQVVTGQNYEAVGYKAFLGNVDLYSSLLPLSILGAASQEMANDEFI